MVSNNNRLPLRRAAKTVQRTHTYVRNLIEAGRVRNVWRKGGTPEKPWGLIVDVEELRNAIEHLDWLDEKRNDAIGLPLKTYDGGRCPSCIYFLFNGTNLVYIGKSICLETRLARHRVDKEYDHVKYLPVESGLLNDYEHALVGFFKPPLNARLVTQDPFQYQFVLEKIGLWERVSEVLQ